jgi:PAS domain S-box-containing protein
MRLQTKIITTILLVFLISLAFLGMLVFSSSKSNILKEIENHLISSSQFVENNINTFVDGQKSKIELIATQSKLSNEELIEMISKDDSFYDLFVINSSGMVIASSNPERIGLYRGDRDYFVNARNQTYVNAVYFALVPKKYSFAVSTPFHGGVLVGSIDLNYLNKFVASRIGLGKTGEVLMAFKDENNNTNYFTKRLFSDDVSEIVGYENTARPMRFALDNKEELVRNIVDYRQKEKVIASTNYIESIKVGLVTKIDESEALEGIKNLRKMTFFLMAVILLIIALVIYIIANKIAREIKNLEEEVNRVTRGDLNVQLNKSSIFEIQGLIDSLNRILASMKLAILRTGVSKSELGVGELEKAKEEAEDKYKILYESSSRAIMTLEPPSWKFTSGNPATLRIFGVKSEEELKKLGPWDLSSERQANGKLSSSEAKKMIEKAMKEGRADFNWVHKKYKGENFNAEVNLVRIKLGGKDVLQAIVSLLKKDN